MNPIEKYFNAEKAESLLFVLVGLAAISFAIYLFAKLKQPYFKGMGYALIAIALIQLTVGITVYIRSPKDIVRVNQIIQTDQVKIKSEEIPRMEVVMKNFVIYRWIEITVLVIGFLMYLYFPPMTFLKGIGLGLIIQAAFMLLLDYFAENRGKIYLEFIKSLG